MNLTGYLKWVAGLATLALAVVCFEPAVRSQSPAQRSGEPARAVRLSYVDGQVQLSQGNQVLAQQAVVNTPLFEGMQLTTADSGKAEIQFEDGSVVRLSPNSSLTLSVLRGAGATADAELNVNSGLAYFEIQGSGQAGQISVHFAGYVATTSGFTVLRVILDNPPGDVAVFSGNAHVEGGNGAVSIDLHGGESVALNAANPANYDLAESIEPNSWDAFNSDRDQALTAESSTETGESANLGESQNPAWSDLDANGSWYDVPGQGQIWSPYDAANPGFDPYGYGNWTYSPGFGYTWASGYPWGYMPFQCGAWNFYDGFGWGWAPGIGGCSPWWGLGFYGGPNIGYFPPGYRPITRPILPRPPVGAPGRPIPLVAVNRHYAFASTAFPARNANTPVKIGDATVIAVRPLPSHSVYAREAFVAGANRTSPANQGSRPAYVSSRSTAGESSQPAPAYRAPQTAPANHGSSSSANHSSGSASHSSGGYSGGGGGASHPSGGGGGGGGASHSSGGGGGGGGGGSHGGGHSR